MSRPYQVLVLFVGLIFLCGGWLYWRESGHAALEPKTRSGDVGKVPDNFEARRQQAHTLQKDAKWCDAKDAWERLRGALPKTAEYDGLRGEVERNLEIAVHQCSPRKQPVESLKLPSPPPDKRPKSIPEDKVIAFYPKGRVVRSLGTIGITGRGTNASWGFKGKANFAYLYRVIAETTVVENRGTAVVFEQEFKDVVQLRAVSEKTLELQLPESPMLDVVWREVDDNLLRPIPGYIVVKKTLQAIERVDPNFKHSLTWIAERLERFGAKIGNDEDVQLAAKLESLAGNQFKIEYVSGLGVTEIKILGGKAFDPDDLATLAANSSMFLDCFMSEVAQAEPGKVVTVDAKDFAVILPFGYDVQLDGELSFTREVNTKGNEEIFKSAGGEVTIRAPLEGIERTVTAKPIAGFVRYSLEEYLVREARASWRANRTWVTTNHLLFGTANVTDVEIQTVYEAKAERPGKPQHAPKSSP